MIWEYKQFATTSDITYGDSAPEVIASTCLFCKFPLTTLGIKPGQSQDGDALGWVERTVRLKVCMKCGWWVVANSRIDYESSGYTENTRAGWAKLRALSLTDISTPLDDLQQYLLANYDDRFRIAPRKLEELVGSIFSNCGYQVRVTPQSGDDGIDVFVLDGPDDAVVGVQVKRYQGAIEAEQIRAFAGALLYGDLTRGVYVTTSGFRSGATTTSRNFGARGMAIELWDAPRLYDALQISARPAYGNIDDPSAPFFNAWTQPDQLPWAASTGMGYE